jgi:hypothetical protein
MGEIVQDILRDVQDMLRSELRLARAEVTDKAQRAGKAGDCWAEPLYAGCWRPAAWLRRASRRWLSRCRSG